MYFTMDALLGNLLHSWRGYSINRSLIDKAIIASVDKDYKPLSTCIQKVIGKE
jgi:hypothetical protein